MIPQENILDLIPQRPPFVMIDKLLYTGDNITRTAFLVKKENVFTEAGEFSEAGLLENIAQTAAARAGYTARQEHKPVAAGFIGAVSNLEIARLPLINEELITEIKIEDHVFDVLFISGSIFCKEELIASCQMKIFLKASA